MKIKKGDIVILKSGMAALALATPSLDDASGEETLTVASTGRGEVIVQPSGGGVVRLKMSDVVGVVEYTQHADPLLQRIIDRTPAHENRLLVMRVGENTAALVTFRSSNPMTKTQAVAAIRNAVTRWMVQTFEGIKAWVESDNDFNVADLSPHLGDRRLLSLLEAFGVHQLAVEHLDPSPDTEVGEHWRYDTVLVHCDNSELKAKTQRGEELPPTQAGSDPDAESDDEIDKLSWDSGRKETPDAQG